MVTYCDIHVISTLFREKHVHCNGQNGSVVHFLLVINNSEKYGCTSNKNVVESISLFWEYTRSTSKSDMVYASFILDVFYSLNDDSNFKTSTFNNLCTVYFHSVVILS